MQRTNGWAQRKIRFPVELDALVLRTDGSRVAVRLSNFSDQGCRVESDGDFHVGEKLKIAMPRMGSVRAQVRWCEPGSFGTRFLTETV